MCDKGLIAKIYNSYNSTAKNNIIKKGADLNRHISQRRHTDGQHYMKRCLEFPSGLAVKDLMLSLLWLRLLLWLELDPWPGNLCMPQVWGKKILYA